MLVVVVVVVHLLLLHTERMALVFFESLARVQGGGKSRFRWQLRGSLNNFLEETGSGFGKFVVLANKSVRSLAHGQWTLPRPDFIQNSFSESAAVRSCEGCRLTAAGRGPPAPTDAR